MVYKIVATIKLRYPLPLENGLQCKIIQGFGNTICRRLEAKLAEHRSLKPRAGLDIPVSPVLQPQGQVPATRSRSSSRSPVKNYEQPPIRDHQADNFPQAHNSEEDDFKLALQLSHLPLHLGGLGCIA